MAEGCMYCEAGDERRLELMTPIVDLKVSTLAISIGNSPTRADVFWFIINISRS